MPVKKAKKLPKPGSARDTFVHLTRYRYFSVDGEPPLVITYCEGRVTAGRSIERREGVSCPACIEKDDAAEKWGTSLRARIEAYEKEGIPEARRLAWMDTEADLGPEPLGGSPPKREVYITKLRGRDGRGAWEVSAPDGARFAGLAFPLHAEVFESREKAEKVREHIAIEKCPDDCSCKK